MKKNSFSKHIDSSDEVRQQIAYQIGKEKFGPIMYSFISWVITEAKNRGIKKLYFLARDGYIMYLCAKEIVEDTRMDIECNYLYCSRVAFRIPSYALISWEEALDNIFLSGYQVSLNKIFDRLLLKEEEKLQLYKEQNISVDEINKILSIQHIEQYKEQFKGSRLLRKIIKNQSKEAYDRTMDYLYQEKVLDQRQIGIVDSGWTGSMQKSLNTLLRSKDFSGKIYGFYFGMYDQPSDIDPCESQYLTYYFSKKGDVLYKALFNNNVFEALCSAPHSMTLGYRYNVDTQKIEPIFASQIKEDNIKVCIRRGIEHYFKQTKKVISRKQALKKMIDLMIFVNKQDAEVLGQLKFTDELTEKQLYLLAPILRKEDLKTYLVFNRICKYKNKDQVDALRVFWPTATVIRSQETNTKVYIVNIIIWEVIKYFKNTLKK